MPDTNSSKPATPHSNARFATTHWTVVLAAGSPDSSRYREALETLCQTYWFPLYAYLRRTGSSTHEAEDYTQGFFARLLERQDISLADPARGKFRSYLLTALKHFIVDQKNRGQAQKRGGGKRLLSLDISRAESRYALEPTDLLSPERLFERSWALTILDRALTRLKAESDRAHKQRLFEQLKVYLSGEADTVPYHSMAERLEMTDTAVRVAVHRLRNRYRELLREEIAHTVASEDQVDEELHALFSALEC
jgi:RNA polymerase sigma factor (sigma-70 family)